MHRKTNARDNCSIGVLYDKKFAAIAAHRLSRREQISIEIVRIEDAIVLGIARGDEFHQRSRVAARRNAWS